MIIGENILGSIYGNIHAKRRVFMLVDDACGSCLKYPQAAISGVNMKAITLVISMVTKYRSCFGSRMSQVQILPPRPYAMKCLFGTGLLSGRVCFGNKLRGLRQIIFHGVLHHFFNQVS